MLFVKLLCVLWQHFFGNGETNLLFFSGSGARVPTNVLAFLAHARKGKLKQNQRPTRAGLLRALRWPAELRSVLLLHGAESGRRPCCGVVHAPFEAHGFPPYCIGIAISRCMNIIHLAGRLRGLGTMSYLRKHDSGITLHYVQGPIRTFSIIYSLVDFFIEALR